MALACGSTHWHTPCSTRVLAASLPLPHLSRFAKPALLPSLPFAMLVPLMPPLSRSELIGAPTRFMSTALDLSLKERHSAVSSIRLASPTKPHDVHTTSPADCCVTQLLAPQFGQSAHANRPHGGTRTGAGRSAVATARGTYASGIHMRARTQQLYLGKRSLPGARGARRVQVGACRVARWAEIGCRTAAAKGGSARHCRGSAAPARHSRAGALCVARGGLRAARRGAARRGVPLSMTAPNARAAAGASGGVRRRARRARCLELSRMIDGQ